MSEASLLAAAVDVVLDHRWAHASWSSHRGHRYNALCAVCCGDVEAILRAALGMPPVDGEPLDTGDLPAHVVHAGTLAADQVIRREFGHGWNAHLVEQITAAVLRATQTPGDDPAHLSR